MTPKEKAEEIIEKYKFVEIANYTSMFEVKQCALIAVDEIMKANHIWYIDSIPYKYWHQVKQEINNL